MKIIKLQAENVKRLKAVEIEPDGNVVVISGANGQGKTSVLDSVWMALGGASAAKGTTKPIRHGQDEASVTLDMGDFTVTRKWKGDKSTLTVMSKDGMKPSSPQKFLDEKLGALSFDPLAFAQSDAKSQLATLLGLVKLPFDPDELAQQRKAIYDERTAIGRDLSEAESLLAALPPVPEGTPEEEVSLVSILDEQDAHDAQNRLVQECEHRMEAAAASLKAIVDEIDRLRMLLPDAQYAYQEASLECESVEAPEAVNFAERIASLEALNAGVRTRRERDSVGTKVGQLTLKRRNLTGELERLDRDKAEALAKAQMPIEGLGFDEDGVTYNGVPFKQASGAEQLRVSVAMAMALNPEIKVIRISDGSLLDSSNMALIAEMANELDYQIWLERVDETGAVGFVIEDGEVKP